MNKISFVVDDSPLHYYQAELLLFSLEHFGKQSRESILVHCTNRVKPEFLLFLSENNYAYKIIEPFLDGKYCNKIRQLESFEGLEKAGGVFFLDTDMFVLAPLQVPYPECFQAKTVDGPNPPLSVIKNIFETAGIKLPPVIETDWVMEDSFTVSTNFNGGFYYIPNAYISIMREAWQAQASWLFQRPELFATESQAIHTDQVAMAMAVATSNIQAQFIASNYNCPTHYLHIQKSFNPETPVYILHYHREVSSFGLLKTANASCESVKNAIGKANSAIAAQHNFTWFAGFRKNIIPVLQTTDQTEHLDAVLTHFKSKHPNLVKLILHGGTPKTGTTSLQSFFDRNPEALKQVGCFYPPNYSTAGNVKKHQWLIPALISANTEILRDNLESISEKLDNDVHTLILSTEGIFNHWNDFGPESRSFLKLFAQHFELKLWVWFRKPFSFMDSLYRQNLKNGKNGNGVYGEDLSLIEMLENEWFRKHLDYIGFVFETEALFGKENVHFFEYKGDIIPTVCSLLNLKAEVHKGENENISLSRAGAPLLRILNRFQLSDEEKGHCLQQLQKIDVILSAHLNECQQDTEAIRLITEHSAQGIEILKKEYGLDLG